jgi:hypothetical protein
MREEIAVMASIHFGTIQEALSQPTSKYFRVSHLNGHYESGDELSFFGKRLPDNELTFDISNNKALANVSLNGSIKGISLYRSSYISDHIPGVWAFKDFSRTASYAYKIRLGEQVHDLAEVDWSFKTSLLDNIFPITEMENKEVKVVLLTYTPLSADGCHRIRGVVYGLFLENISTQRITGDVILPGGETTDPYLNPEGSIQVADFKHKSAVIPFDLALNQSIWVPAVIYGLGDPVIEEIDKLGSLAWLNSTWSYFKGMTGTLEMPDDSFTAEFFGRSVYQCMGSVGMDGSGKIAGSNWGSYPTTREIWSKDMYYSFLPLFMLETELFKQGLQWFTEYSVRPRGAKYEGGVKHSLSNALTPVVMAGLYYASTGDKAFFLEHQHLHKKWKELLEQTIASRENKDVWLFPSIWLSDAYSLGDYHTGSNVVAWYAFKAYARVLLEVYGEVETAADYGLIADKIKEALDGYNTVEGPFGRQYLEGTSQDRDRKTFLRVEATGSIYDNFGIKYIADLIRDNEIDLMMHDGEESDTTLMPLYGYLAYDDITYKNYMRFTMSPHNPTYNLESRGIQWGVLSSATFPGYLPGLANVADAETMSGASGYLTEIRKLTDVDGSLWWWPYANGETYGNVMRHNRCGKCAWAAGVFTGLFISEILGIRYDAPSKTLFFRPFSPSSSFSWKDFRIGKSIFSARYSRTENEICLSVVNQNDHRITAQLEVSLQEHQIGNILRDTIAMPIPSERGKFLDQQTIQFSELLLPGEAREIRIV